MSVQITFEAEDGATLAGLVASFANPGPSVKEELMPFFDELMAQIGDLKAAAASEHDQVKAAFDALQAQVGDVVTADQKAQIDAAFADTKAAIGGVFEPPAPTPPPAA